MGLLSWPYPEESTGYWGETTSTIDWCEQNYVVSPYIAEWANTISNISYLIAALYSTRSTYRNGLELRFYLIGAGYALVGVGSSLFHMTLQYRFQLLDELPMIYAMSIPVWSLICETLDEFGTGRENEKIRERKKFKDEIYTGSIIFAIISIVSWVYLMWRNTNVHEVLFGILVVTVAFTAGLLTYRHVLSYETKRNLYSSMGIGVVFFLSGFVSWKLDIRYCSFWIGFRRNVLELPLGIFFELHGWWHMLTGIGIYYYIVYLQYLRVITLGIENEHVFIWRWKLLPELIPKGMAVGTKYSLKLFGPIEKQNIPTTESRKTK
ncbi:hypothetical protein NCAS_0B02040 [Naumovozyma castellii]|uniref:Alkaline ceramidase YPC1 n=1 Tax=Naumovozyma castellii TaxID=27288 RepID=G0VBG2_NAUCA|nr:hypothetical protein NCAS_0B02040 [Naumovozyma castellii CBS 4309]CCC68288.1 hypothetical protein NCAS_0B02040 [Naumovozyma castellii CBS 4309]